LSTAFRCIDLSAVRRPWRICSFVWYRIPNRKALYEGSLSRDGGRRAELKRTLALRLAICGPMIIVLLVFGIYVQRGEKMGGANPLTGFAQLILTIWTIIMFPLYAALAAALLAAIEHQTETWKHLLALPVHCATIFLAKWITGIGLLLLSSLVLSAGVSIAAEVLRLIRPAWSSSPLPSAMIFSGGVLSFLRLRISVLNWLGSSRGRRCRRSRMLGPLAARILLIARMT
jgi:ABC-2 family transporter protein